MVGTPYNLAPEVELNGFYTALADIYSLGIVVYQLIFNKYPFYGGTPL